MTEHNLEQLVAEATQRCYSAAFADACDRIGLRTQTLPPRVKRLAGTGTVVGWARTFTSVAVSEDPVRPYGGEIDFVDSLAPGQVAIGRVENDAAGWGELFSSAAMGRGAVGLVIDGLIRDLDQIHDLGFPVHATGTRPTDARGRVSMERHDEPIDIDGTQVRSGDLVAADADGVTVVPAERAAEVLAAATEKARTERDAMRLLLEGGTLGDVWERFRVM